MKSPDLWSKLPTPSELLANPRVRSVVDRLNPTVVTARVRSFLDEVRGELAHRGDKLSLPTMAELADRVSRYLTHADAYHVGPVINATGAFRGGPWLSAPLADAAVERMLLVAQDFAAADPGAPGSECAAPDCDATRRLCELTGAGAAAVFATHAGALQAALRSLAPRGELVVARGEVTTIEPECRLTDLAGAAGARLREVGAADRVTLDDYFGALATECGGVLRVESGRAGARDGERPSLEELVDASKRHRTDVIVELDCAPVDDAIDFGDPRPLSVKGAIEAGARLVVVRGDGLIGGPSCGIVLGEADAVSEVVRGPLANAARVDALRAGALAATAELLRSPERARLAIPTIALLTAPLENLRTRAERLAPQIAASPLVEAGEASELPEPNPALGLPVSAPSWGIRITPAGHLDEFCRRLRSRSPRLWLALDGGRALVNLRTVLPRQDLAIVAALHPEEGHEAEGETPPERADG